MHELSERVCTHCGDPGESKMLERCTICYRWFCSDCSYKGAGRRFCSERCSLEYIYGDLGEDDDDFDPTVG
jgi:hypothetical protein